MGSLVGMECLLPYGVERRWLETGYIFKHEGFCPLRSSSDELLNEHVMYVLKVTRFKFAGAHSRRCKCVGFHIAHGRFSYCGRLVLPSSARKTSFVRMHGAEAITWTAHCGHLRCPAWFCGEFVKRRTRFVERVSVSIFWIWRTCFMCPRSFGLNGLLHVTGHPRVTWYP